MTGGKEPTENQQRMLNAVERSMKVLQEFDDQVNDLCAMVERFELLVEFELYGTKKV